MIYCGSLIAASMRKSSTTLSKWVPFAGSLVAFAACIALLRCVPCSGVVNLLPVWAVYGATIASGVLCLAFAFEAASDRKLIWARALNIAMLTALPLVFYAGLVASARPCPFCMFFWGGLALTLLASHPTSFLPRLFLVFLAATIGIESYLLREQTPNSFLRKSQGKVFLAKLGFSFERHHVSPTDLQLQGEASRVRDGVLLFQTACSPCLNKTVGQLLSRRKIPVANLALVAPTSERKWQVPPGYGKSRQITDMEMWKQAKLSEGSAPILAVVKHGKIVEVLP